MEPNLRRSSVFWENLWFSAVSCALQMLEFPEGGVNLRKSEVFCKKYALWALSMSPNLEKVQAFKGQHDQGQQD